MDGLMDLECVAKSAKYERRIRGLGSSESRDQGLGSSQLRGSWSLKVWSDGSCPSLLLGTPSPATLEDSSGVCYRVKHSPAIHPSIPRYLPKGVENRIYTWMLPEASFMSAGTWKPSGCPSARDGCINWGPSRQGNILQSWQEAIYQAMRDMEQT